MEAEPPGYAFPCGAWEREVNPSALLVEGRGWDSKSLSPGGRGEGEGGVVIQDEPKVDPYRSAGHLFTKRASPQLLAALPPKKQNLRDPIAFIPEVQALSAPGGLGL
jgi:hypothetical protein